MMLAVVISLTQFYVFGVPFIYLFLIQLCISVMVIHLFPNSCFVLSVVPAFHFFDTMPISMCWKVNEACQLLHCEPGCSFGIMVGWDVVDAACI